MSDGRKRFRKFAIVCCIILGVLLAYVLHFASRDSLEKYQAELRAGGEKLTIYELIPPGVPDEENGAELLREAARLLTNSTTFKGSSVVAMQMVAPGKAIVGWMQADVRSTSGTNTWREVDVAVGQWRPALKLLHQAGIRPVIDFEFDYQHAGLTFSLPHQTQLSKISCALSAAAVCDLHLDDTGTAVSHMHAMHGIVKSWENERFVIEQFIRLAILQVCLSGDWELLQSSRITEEQLVLLQRDWTDLELIQPAENALQFERAFMGKNISDLRGSNSPFSSFCFGETPPRASGGWLAQLKGLPESAWNDARLKTKETLWRASWSYADELRTAKAEQALLVSLRQVRTNGYFADALREQQRQLKLLGLDSKEIDMSWVTATPNDLDPRDLISKYVPALGKLIDSVMTAEGARQMAISAIALKRFQLKHGHYPNDLAALVPEFVPSVPIDPVDGKPMRYRPDSDGTFLLYSVGLDGKDDGGDPNPDPAEPGIRIRWQSGRDWVWPRPATAEEIKAFEGDPPSK